MVSRQVSRKGSRRASPEPILLVLPATLTRPQFPTSLRLGYEILTSTAIAYYSSGRTGAHVFWSAASQDRSVAKKAPEYTIYLPTRYGNNECLDATMNCVLSTIEEVFRNGKSYDRRQCNISYGNALGLLRKSLESEDFSGTDMGSTTSSILLLAIYESLVGANSFSWSTHMSGLAKIYARAGPSCVTSAHEKSILHAGIGGFIAEAYINNTACFLDEPEWQTFLHEVLEDKPDITSLIRPARTFLAGLCRIPGLLSCCRAIIENPIAQASIREDVVEQAWDLRTDLMALIPSTLANLSKHATRPGIWTAFSKEERRMGEYCSLLVSIALLTRIIISLTGETVELEVEANSMATIVIDIHEQALQVNNQGDPDIQYRTTKLRYAFAIAQTHDVFRKQCLKNAFATEAGDNLINQADFLDFHERVRGKIHPNRDWDHNSLTR